MRGERIGFGGTERKRELGYGGVEGWRKRRVQTCETIYANYSVCILQLYIDVNCVISRSRFGLGHTISL